MLLLLLKLSSMTTIQRLSLQHVNIAAILTVALHKILKINLNLNGKSKLMDQPANFLAGK